MKSLFAVIAFMALVGGQANASILAIIDSGTDLNHDLLKNNKWTNKVDIDDAVDNDNNGMIDDLHGWNFAENNNKLFDKTLLGTFSPDVYKFFEIQTRILEGTATQSDRDWLNQARSNQQLLTELQTFGNFVHGTHVAGISAQLANQTEVLVLKIMPTKVPSLPKMGMQWAKKARQFQMADMGPIIKMGLKVLAGQQAKQLSTFSAYVNAHKAQVANCSFGSSVTSAKMILGPILKMALGREPTEDELKEYGKYFMTEVVAAGKPFATTAPKTLFVIAAGNDATNNDDFPVFPASLREPNTLTVAATRGRSSIASFSNFGQTVDVAAPGVGIESGIPGNEYLKLSGTSQASPYVAGVAADMMDLNPALKPQDLRQIIMGTVDVKGFLRGKVSTSGVVNPQRATLAASLSKGMSVASAILSSRMQIADVQVPFTEWMSFHAEEGYVLPLPSLLGF